VYLADYWPGTNADETALAAFYRRAASVYDAAARTDTTHRKEAAWWARECQHRAERYTTTGQPHTHDTNDG
jgi:hypothetical protein